MLTRLRVKGFKNLLDIDVRFGPFTCIAGRNAAGKSNLFDAIRFLSLLTQHSVAEATQKLRESEGRSQDPADLFTALGSWRAPELRFVAELLVERGVTDDFGVPAEAAISTVRYELAFRLGERDGYGQLEIAHESLKPITVEEAGRALRPWASTAFRRSALGKRRTEPFISTETKENEEPSIRVHQEGHGGRRVPALKSSRTVLSGMASSDFPTILAVHREMQRWQTLMLEPSAMRAPSDYRDPKWIDSRGAHLAGAVQRLTRGEQRPGQVYAELANRLARLIEDAEEVRVVDDERTESYILQVRSRNGIYLPARSLSDGTLRFLVLAALAIDPETRGLICLEEPENGIHPQRIPAILDLLDDIAVDGDLPVGADNPLRQVIINTHAPEVVRRVRPQDLVYLSESHLRQAHGVGSVARLTAPPGTWRVRDKGAEAETALGDLAPYGYQLPLPIVGA